MNLEYLWWILALILAGGGVVAFLAFGRVPEIEDEPYPADAPAEAPTEAPRGAAEPGAAEPDSS